MEMFNVHQGATLIPINISSKDYSFNGEKLKAVSVSASKDKSGAVHISLVNIDAKNAQDITVDVGTVPAKNITGRILTSGKLQNYNSFEHPDVITPVAFNCTSLKAGKLNVKLPPFSVVVLELK
jgi:alpha-N-arabinofuranosidase